MLKSQANWSFTYKEMNHDKNELNELDISQITKDILLQRGITSIKEAEDFLKPSLESLLDPSLLAGIEKAALRVKKAIDEGESILVYGDYDADGVTSTTLMVETLNEMGAMCDYYIPNRFTEGYGPNKDAFKQIYQQGFNLIITVDNGIAGLEAIDYATELGLDVIVTDHHEAQDQLPNAYAILHPKCSEDYTFKELAGVGVAFKFAWYLLGYFPKQFLDLVAIGTIADLVPLIEENRILTYHGLKVLSKTNRVGLKALMDECGLEGTITEVDVGFKIGPRLNAVGRLQDANLAVELLLIDDLTEARNLAQHVQTLNTERQKIVSDITKEAVDLIENDTSDRFKNVIVVAKEGWNQGVLGIVASKLVQLYHKPTLVLTLNEEAQYAKGSARSIEAFDLFKECMQIRSLFTHFGGHAQAAGMTLPIHQIEAVREQLSKRAEENLSEKDFYPNMFIDFTVDVNDVTMELLEEMENLAPFGMGNPKPLFHISAKPDNLKQIGAEKNHLKFQFRKDKTLLDVIGFGFGAVFHKIMNDSQIEVVGELQTNEWNGIKKPQFFLKDLRINEWQLFDYRGITKWQKSLEAIQHESVLVYFEELPKALPSSWKEKAIHIEKLKWNKQDLQHLILIELPSEKETLTDLLQKVDLDSLYLCYQAKLESGLSLLPRREDFKELYGLVMKRGYFDYKVDAPKLSKYKGWKLEKIKFMFQVFYELNFVKMNDGNIIPNQNVEKKDLETSKLYQKLKKQIEVEALLYYSSRNDVKIWMDKQRVPLKQLEEEMSYGL